MKKIGIYLSVGPHAGGSFQYCLSVIKHLKNLNKKKYKIVAITNNVVWKKLLPKHFSIVLLGKASFSKKYVHYLNYFLFSDILIKKVNHYFDNDIKTINNLKCDLMIFPSQEDLSFKIYSKSLTTIHDLMHKYETRFREFNFIEKLRRNIQYQRICDSSFRVFVDSKVGKKHLIESFKIDLKKILISHFEVPTYLKKSKKKNIFKIYNIPKKKFIFYPAQFWEHKNHINLIKSFKLIRDKIKDINLILVGVEKNNLKNIKFEIEKFNLKKNVFVIGYIKNEDVYSFYRYASLLAYVSHCGPTNIPPLEAMQVGCPLICSNVYGMPKQVGDGAKLVDPNSHKDIAKKILSVLTQKNIRKNLIKNGKKQLKKNNKQNFFYSLKKVLSDI